MEPDSIPLPVRERIEKIGHADLVIAIVNLNGPGGDASQTVREALAELDSPPRTVLIETDGAGAAIAESDGAEQSPFILPWSLFRPEPSGALGQSLFTAYRSIFAAGDKLEVKACCVIASDLSTITKEWIAGLAHPVLDSGFDLVTPSYTRHKFEGLINNSVIAPLFRSLYGKRLQNPMGPDLGLSRRMIQRMLATFTDATKTNHPLASLAPSAIASGFQICQAHVGERINPPTDWTNLSSLLALILGPIFVEMERNAAVWQRTRGSTPIQEFGEPARVTQETSAIDVRRMIESFQLGARNLHEIWSLVLPAGTLFELRKLARLTPEQFRIPDELWVRIVYDFALGHRLRIISRDHLLRAMTPLYLGWVASYALEMETASPYEVDERLERLALAYEAGKPYLVSRWRWPDRFNP